MTILNEQDYVFDHQSEPRLSTTNSILKNKRLQQITCLENCRKSTAENEIKHISKKGFIKNVVRLICSYRKPSI